MAIMAELKLVVSNVTGPIICIAGSLAYLFWILMACGLESNKRITRNYKKEGLEAR